MREKFGRNLAIVGQDNLRRIVLRERDRPGGADIGLIDLTTRYALNNGFHVVVEGILYAEPAPAARQPEGSPRSPRSPLSVSARLCTTV